MALKYHQGQGPSILLLCHPKQASACWFLPSDLSYSCSQNYCYISRPHILVLPHVHVFIGQLRCQKYIKIWLARQMVWMIAEEATSGTSIANVPELYPYHQVVFNAWGSRLSNLWIRDKDCENEIVFHVLKMMKSIEIYLKQYPNSFSKMVYRMCEIVKI